MAYSVGVKSVYYDVMYVLGDHSYRKFDALPCGSDDDGEPVLTWKHNILWWLYQKCIPLSLNRGTFVHSSIHDFPQVGHLKLSLNSISLANCRSKLTIALFCGLVLTP